MHRGDKKEAGHLFLRSAFVYGCWQAELHPLQLPRLKVETCDSTGTARMRIPLKETDVPAARKKEQSKSERCRSSLLQQQVLLQGKLSRRQAPALPWMKFSKTR